MLDAKHENLLVFMLFSEMKLKKLNVAKSVGPEDTPEVWKSLVKV